MQSEQIDEFFIVKSQSFLNLSSENQELIKQISIDAPIKNMFSLAKINMNMNINENPGRRSSNQIDSSSRALVPHIDSGQRNYNSFNFDGEQ